MAYNCAVIGLGNVGFGFKSDSKRKEVWTHAEAYAASGPTKLVAAVEINPAAIEAFKKTYRNVPVYRSVEELFKNHKIDLVSISVPTKMHFSIFSKVVRHDLKAIFCEKPLSRSITESGKMVDIAKKRNVILAVNYSRRWQNSFNHAKNLIQKGKIGRITAVSSFYTGRIYSLGSHLFDSLLMITGMKPVLVSATYVRRGADPSLSGWLKLRGTKGIAFASFISTGKQEDLVFEIDIIGDKGRLRIADNGYEISQFIFKKSRRYSGYRELAPLKVEIPRKNERFIDAILNIVDVMDGKRKSIRCLGQDALAVDRIIEKSISSARNKGVPETI